MSVIRVMGTETEYAVSAFDDADINPLQLPGDVVAAAADPLTRGIRWDYAQEDPTHDARGMRLNRAAAPRSMLTDAPQLHITNVIAPNGGRIYVDHAHPEYSAPETTDPFLAVCYDHAGDILMEHAALQASERTGRSIQLHRNNVDGKGASWGTHENYQMLRRVPFQAVQRLMTAHFVTRQVFAGSGRVGIGERSQIPGFQLSQRADYIHSRVGLQTTFDRPIINTRDESHSTDTYRRLHVIVGDANRMDVPQALKLGTSSMLLWMLETQYASLSDAHADDAHADDAWDWCEGSVDFVDPVDALHAVSHDLSLAAPLAMSDGSAVSAIDMQRRLYDAVERAGFKIYGHLPDDVHAVAWPDEPTSRIMRLWNRILGDVERVRDADDDQRLMLTDEASRIEWLAKWQLMEMLRRRIDARQVAMQRASSHWSDPQLQALDLAWSALDSRNGVFAKLHNRFMPLMDEEELLEACKNAPVTTRAWLRAQLIRKFPDQVVGVTWGRITVRDIKGGEHSTMLSLDMRDSSLYDLQHCQRILSQATSAASAVEMIARALR